MEKLLIGKIFHNAPENQLTTDFTDRACDECDIVTEYVVA